MRRAISKFRLETKWQSQLEKIPAQLQLTDDIKRQYPGSAIVNLLIQQLSNVPSLTGGGGKILAVNTAED